MGRTAARRTAPSHGRARGRAAPAENGSCTILLVEDDSTSRMVIADVLEAEGFRVLAAGSVQQARELAARRDAPIDLLLTDVNLQDGDGTSFARELRGTHPEVLVIVMSGAFEAPSENDRFVAKPIDLERLLDVLHVSLERRFDRR